MHSHPIDTYIESLGIAVPLALSLRLLDFRPQTFAKGEHFIKEGAFAKTIAFVLSGQVRHYYRTDDKEHTRWVALAGSFTVAFKSFVQEVPSRASLVCITPTELLVMQRADFYALLNEFEAMRRFWTHCLEVEMSKYEDRVTHLITADTTDRYLAFVRDYPVHAREVPLKYIASMLGVDPRHLSRVRAQLASGRK